MARGRGREVPGRGGVRDVVDPATGAAFAEVSLLDAAQAAEAMAAARAAFPAWAALGFAERGRLLLRLRTAILEDGDALAALIAREQGKPAAEAHLVEIFPALAALKHLALHAEDAAARRARWRAQSRSSPTRTPGSCTCPSASSS